jgi:hypothetical protein
VFSDGLDGHLRAYFADDGKIAWDKDTKSDYQTVNGVGAKGGSINGGDRYFWRRNRERAARILGRRTVMLRLCGASGASPNRAALCDAI